MKELSDLTVRDLVQEVQGKRKKRAAKRVIDYDEFDELTQKILKKDVLEGIELDVFNKLNQIFTVYSTYPKKSQALTIVKKMLSCSAPTANTWLNHAVNFFGEIERRSLKAKRYLYEQRLEAMLEHADIDQQTRIMKLLIEVSGVKNADADDKKPKRKLTIRRTTNPKALIEEIERTDYG